MSEPFTPEMVFFSIPDISMPSWAWGQDSSSLTQAQTIALKQAKSCLKKRLKVGSMAAGKKRDVALEEINEAMKEVHKLVEAASKSAEASIEDQEQQSLMLPSWGWSGAEMESLTRSQQNAKNKAVAYERRRVRVDAMAEGPRKEAAKRELIRLFEEAQTAILILEQESDLIPREFTQDQLNDCIEVFYKVAGLNLNAAIGGDAIQYIDRQELTRANGGDNRTFEAIYVNQDNLIGVEEWIDFLSTRHAQKNSLPRGKGDTWLKSILKTLRRGCEELSQSVDGTAKTDTVEPQSSTSHDFDNKDGVDQDQDQDQDQDEIETDELKKNMKHLSQFIKKNTLSQTPETTSGNNQVVESNDNNNNNNSENHPSEVLLSRQIADAILVFDLLSQIENGEMREGQARDPKVLPAITYPNLTLDI